MLLSRMTIKHIRQWRDEGVDYDAVTILADLALSTRSRRLGELLMYGRARARQSSSWGDTSLLNLRTDARY